LFSYNVASHALSNVTDNYTSAALESNVTTSVTDQSSSSGNPAVTNIDVGRSAINSGDSDGAKENMQYNNMMESIKFPD